MSEERGQLGQDHNARESGHGSLEGDGEQTCLVRDVTDRRSAWGDEFGRKLKQRAIVGGRTLRLCVCVRQMNRQQAGMTAYKEAAWCMRAVEDVLQSLSG